MPFKYTVADKHAKGASVFQDAFHRLCIGDSHLTIYMVPNPVDADIYSKRRKTKHYITKYIEDNQEHTKIQCNQVTDSLGVCLGWSSLVLCVVIMGVLFLLLCRILS